MRAERDAARAEVDQVESEVAQQVATEGHQARTLASEEMATFRAERAEIAQNLSQVQNMGRY